ncbi:AMP-binding protein [Lysinibacillus sp. NPDC093692]|uniref:non-ribosomal peptide synthetase n=1 Tax=Lysinibacillus sp. NPDC093692 TaxID=3390578 RepID=UPI003CFF5388
MEGNQKHIGVFVENKLHFLECLCGIILSGDIIVPLNIEYSNRNIIKIIKDCEIDTILTEEKFLKKFVDISLIKNIVLIDKDNEMITQSIDKTIIPIGLEKTELLDTTIRDVEDTQDNFVYAVYTSGSTGSPKGIRVSNYNLMHLFKWLDKFFELSDKTISFQHLSLNFDFGLKELFNVLLNGGKLILSTNEEKYNPFNAVSKINLENVNMLYTTPTMFRELLNQEVNLPSLRLICLGGEALDYSLVQKAKKFLRDDVSIFNGYGPSETSINALMYKVDWKTVNRNDIKAPVPIGTPSGNNNVILLDENLNLLPEGVEGEIYIGGPGVTNGYINEPDLTRKSFITLNFEGNKSVYYRTGDLAIYNEKRELVFIGRKDEQVKIRGYRVELKEIESILNQLSFVKQSVVIYEHKLVAYLVLEKEIHSVRNVIFKELNNQLPSYMIPGFLVQIPEIPKNINGKTDKKKLQSYSEEEKILLISSSITKNKTEKRILQCWEAIIGEGKVESIDTNFFEVGGHSLNAYKLLEVLEQEFNRKFKIMDIFEYFSILKFRNFLENGERPIIKDKSLKDKHNIMQEIRERRKQL